MAALSDPSDVQPSCSETGVAYEDQENRLGEKSQKKRWFGSKIGLVWFGWVGLVWLGRFGLVWGWIVL